MEYKAMSDEEVNLHYQSARINIMNSFDVVVEQEQRRIRNLMIIAEDVPAIKNLQSQHKYLNQLLNILKED